MKILTLTLKMTTSQVVETSVSVNNNSPIQDYVHSDDQTQPLEMTPGFKPFTKLYLLSSPRVKFIVIISSPGNWILGSILKKDILCLLWTKGLDRLVKIEFY